MARANYFLLLFSEKLMIQKNILTVYFFIASLIICVFLCSLPGEKWIVIAQWGSPFTWILAIKEYWNPIFFKFLISLLFILQYSFVGKILDFIRAKNKTKNLIVFLMTIFFVWFFYNFFLA